MIRSSGALQDLLGGFLVYRSLVPVDDRLPTIGDLRPTLGLGADRLPRKAEFDYARVVGEIAREARVLSGISKGTTRLLFVGDTMRNDVSAFSNLCAAMGWTGHAFIADEAGAAAHEVRQLGDGQQLTISSRWCDIEKFVNDGWAAGFGCDEETVVVVDIDKTLVGARGRNDHVIDKARQRAAYEVVQHLDDGAWTDETSFKRIYDRINDPIFHPLTEDNQDAVAYSSLLVACGWMSLDELAARVGQGWICGFKGLMDEVAKTWSSLPSGIIRLHEAVREQVEAGNPTPFVAFRHAEYRCTAERMGHLPDGTSRETMLDEEIVITEEVWQAIGTWQARGCLLFGLSDKPDEACFPPADCPDALPIHGIRTHIVGGRR